MPGPAFLRPTWMQCTGCAEHTPLRSLLSLEEQLELSFSQLRHGLVEVRAELASLGTETVPVLESPRIESVRLGPELEEPLVLTNSLRNSARR
eukprot:s2423_g11.t1